MDVLHIDINTRAQTAFSFGTTVTTRNPCGITTSRTVFETSPVKGWHEEMQMEDFKIIQARMKFSEKPGISFNYSGKAVEMLFILKGSFNVHFNLPETRHGLSKHTHNLLYCDNTHGIFEPAHKELHFICIRLRPEFFEKFLPAEKSFHTFRTAISNRRTGYFNNVNYPVSPQMHVLLRDILKTDREGHYLKIFLHARVLELLFLQIEQYGNTPLNTQNRLSPSDRDKIYQARDYLLKNYGQKITLNGLAKKIGTNEFLLKNGFKTVFGTTVFGCIHHLRMTRAKQLLLEQKLTVSQVSDIAGYKNPQHFSTAFKKKFGMVPSKFKNG